MAMTEAQLLQLIDMTNNTFIWEFKKGDNIVYNFQILWILYESRLQSNEQHLFNKPIIISIASIIECILDDFVQRIQQRTRDPLPNITSEIIHDFKYREKDGVLEFNKLESVALYLKQAEKHNLFDQPKIFYENLWLLKNARDRVHIQNRYGKLEANEDRVFSDARLKLSEEILEIVIDKMVSKFPRSSSPTPQDINLFPFPWKLLKIQIANKEISAEDIPF